MAVKQNRGQQLIQSLSIDNYLQPSTFAGVGASIIVAPMSTDLICGVERDGVDEQDINKIS